MVSVCSRTERLAALFRCTLPFSAVEPYVTTSGLVPPELFYGREHEQRSIMDRHGTCFIYGGRQLGKTALLRRVERDFHNPRSRHLAKWIDLKVGGIGSARGAPMRSGRYFGMNFVICLSCRLYEGRIQGTKDTSMR